MSTPISSWGIFGTEVVKQGMNQQVKASAYTFDLGETMPLLVQSQDKITGTEMQETEPRSGSG